MTTTYVPASELIGDAWPHWLGTAPNLDFLDSIGVSRVGVSRAAGGGLPAGAKFDLAILDQLELELPFLPGFALHTGAPGAVTSFSLEVDTAKHFVIRIAQVPITLHLPPSILQRWVCDSAGKWTADVDPQTNEPKGFDFVLSSGIEIDFDTESVSLDTPSLSIPADAQNRTVGAMIASTGVIVTMVGLHLVLQDTPPAGSPYPAWVPPGFRGVAFDSATVAFANEHSVLGLSTATLTDCAIGAGGFTGTIELDLGGTSVVPSSLPGGTLFGIECRLKSFGVTFVASVPTASSIQAYLQIPFFSDPAEADKWLEVEASIGGQSGDLLVRLSGAGQGAQLVTLDRPGFCKLDIASLAFHVEEGVPGIELTGKLTPQITGFDWPAFDLDGLRVDAEGHVRLPRGMLTLPKAAHLDLGGFAVEVSAIGFGKYDSSGVTRQYFAFSGGIQLCDDLAGAEVRNLRVSWPTTLTFSNASPSDFDVTCEGISIDVEVPEVLKLSGSVDFSTNRFAGSALLVLVKPFEATFGVVFVVGNTPATATARAYKYWYVNVLLSLPVGIPVAQTGTAVFGGEALVGKNWVPDKLPNQSWFEDWYLKSPKGLGLSATAGAQPSAKWKDRDRSWLFGAGVKIGTLSDKGRAIAMKVLVAVSTPGPTVLIEGLAQFLDDPSKLETGDPPFRAVAILDFENEEFLLGIAAHYEKPSVIDITATSEAYFSLRDRGAWRFDVGKDTPESKRVQALVLSTVHASAFFMLDARQLRTGASVSWGYSAKVGPLSAGFFVGFEERVDIFWHPLQLAGSVRLSGNVHLTAFGIGLSLAVDAGLSAQARTPLSIAGSVHVALNLPRPLRDVEGDVSFSWTRQEAPDYWIDPLESMALVHPLASVTQAWTPTSTEQAAPTVPLDAHPVLSFGRPLNPGTSVAGVPPATSVAKPGTLGFQGELLPGVAGRFVARLTSFTLERRNSATSWEVVSQSASPLAPWNGQVDLQSAAWGTWLDHKDRNGDWAPLTFELWNRYAFNRTDDLGSVYQSQSILQLGQELCDTGAVPAPHCADFTNQSAGQLVGPVFRHEPGLFSVSRTAGIGARNDPAMPRVLFLQEGTVLDLALDFAAARLDIDFDAVPGPVTVTPVEGAMDGQAQAVTGDTSVTLKATTSAGITHVRIEVPGHAPAGYTNDGVIRVPATGWSISPSPDCLGIVEDLLLALVERVPPASVKSLLLKLERCVSATEECRDLYQPLADSVRLHLTSSAAAPPGSADVATAAARLMDCLLTRQNSGLREGCRGELERAGRLLKREIAIFGRLTRQREPALSRRVESFHDLVTAARASRALLADCDRGRKADEIVVALGDPADHGRWLTQIPGLSADDSAPGCAIKKICWVTLDEADAGAVSLEMNNRSDSIMSQFSADLPLLRPYSTYRITATTSMENGSVAGSPKSWTHTSYFKTAGPPGGFVAGNPLDRLEPYLATSMPPDGATDVFTSYDLGLIFRQPYVNGMYANQGVTLELHIYGPDDTPAKDASGAPIILSNSWSSSSTTTLESYQEIIGLVLDTSNCQLPAVTYQHDSMTSAPLATGVDLQPNTRYVVKVRSGAVGATRETLAFGFRTGRHRDFASLIAATRTSGPLVTVPPNGGVSSTSLLNAALGSLRPINDYDVDGEDLELRAVLASFSRMPRTPVATSRATLLSDGASAPLILFEFDQPIDLRRLTATLFLDPPSTSPPSAPGSALAQSLDARTDSMTPKILRSGEGRAVLLATSGNMDMSAKRVTIAFKHCSAVIDSTHFPNEPHLLRGGVDIDESAAAQIDFYVPPTVGVE